MKITINLTTETAVRKKVKIIDLLFDKINCFLETADYGSDLLELNIDLSIVNPSKEYEHLYKSFKPRYINHKIKKNSFTGESYEINKSFYYSILIKGDKYMSFVNSTDKVSESILAKSFLESFSNFDFLPKKVKDFNREKFESDLHIFLNKDIEQN